MPDSTREEPETILFVPLSQEEAKTPAEQLLKHKKKQVQQHFSDQESPVRKKLRSSESSGFAAVAIEARNIDTEYLKQLWETAKINGFAESDEIERVIELCERNLFGTAVQENTQSVAASLALVAAASNLPASLCKNTAKIALLRALPTREVMIAATRIFAHSEDIPFAEARQLAKRGLLTEPQEAIELLSTLFASRPEKRVTLLEDAVALATADNEVVLFSEIKISTALLLSLLEGTAVWTQDQENNVPTAKGARRCAALAAEFWLKRCREKSLGRKGLTLLAEDLVLVLTRMHQWPAAEIMTAALAKRLSTFILEAKDDPIITEAIEALGILLGGIVALRTKEPSAMELAAAQHLVLTSTKAKKRLFLAARFCDLVLTSDCNDKEEEDEAKSQEMLAHFAAHAIPTPQEETQAWPVSKVTASRHMVAAWASPEISGIALERLLAQQLGAAKAAVRARALKALESALKANVNGLNDAVQQAMRARLRDEAASVRQAAVEVLSVADDDRFKEALLDRLRDRALGVRKAAVRYVRRALAAKAKNDPTDFAQRALSQLAARCAAPDEEDTVKNLAVDAVRDAWFGPLNPGVESSQELPSATRQLIAVVVDVGAEDSCLVLALVLKSALGGEKNCDEASSLASCASGSSSSVAKEAREKKRRGIAEQRAAAHVKALVSELLRLESVEEDTSESEVAVLRAICALANADPRLGASAAWSLAPLLHQSSGTAVCCAAAEALAACIPGMARREALALAEDAVPALGTASHALGGSKALEATIVCLAAFATLGQASAVKTLHSLANTYLGALDAVTSRPAGTTPSPARKRGAGARAMVVLGLVCQYFGHALPDTFLNRVYSALIAALLRSESAHQQRSPAAKVRAVTALAGLVEGCPQFASTAALDGTVATVLFHPQEAIQARARQAWAHLLDGCGKNALRLTTDDEDATAQHLESVGAAVQSHLPQLLETLRQGNASELRRASLSLLSAALRHGLLNPRDAVPELMAALSDSDPSCRAIAQESLTKIHARRPSFVTTRFVQGLVLALDATSDKYAHIVLPALARTYTKLILPDAKARICVLRSIVALFAEAPPSAATASSLLMWLNSKRRAVRLLALLPASSQEDPLFLLYHIGRILSVQAADFRDGEVPTSPNEVAKASAYALLLRLRRHLRRHFHLSDAKCLAYVPSTPIKTPARSLTSSSAHSAFHCSPPDYHDLDLDFPIPLIDKEQEFATRPMSSTLRSLLNDFNVLFDVDIVGQGGAASKALLTAGKRRQKPVEDNEENQLAVRANQRKKADTTKMERPKKRAAATSTTLFKRTRLSRTSKINVCYSSSAFEDHDDEC